MNKFNVVLLLLVFFTLLGCSEDPPNDASPVDEKVEKSHMLSDQEKMIQKAKDTEKLIKEADEKRRKALEDQGG